jgi:hypothetical protein
MTFKLKDVKPNRYPVGLVGRKSERGFNTTTTKVRAKCGKGVLEPEVTKSSVNCKRINTELTRRAIAQAQFIPIPVLVMPDGTGRIPLKYHSAR